MKNLKFLMKIIKGYKIVLILLIIFNLIIAYTRTIVPQFLSYAIDTILMDKPTQFVDFFDNIVQTSNDPKTQIIILCAILIAFQLVRAALLYARSIWYFQTSEKIIKRFRERLYVHMQNLPFSYFKKNNSGDLIQRATTDVDAIRTFIGGEFFQFVWTITIIITTIIMMIQINLIYALSILTVVPFIFFISLYYSFVIQRQYREIDHHEGKMTDTVKENITNVEVVKAFGSQKYEYEKYEERSKPYYKGINNFFNSLAKMESTTLIFRLLQYLIVLGVGIILVENNSTTVGIIVLFLSYTKLLSNPIQQLGRLFSRLGRLGVALERTKEIFDAKTETIETEMPEIDGDIEFKDVSFKFEDSNVHAIYNVNFKIKKGSNVAIVGKTGSGKSTLINLLCRMFDPNEGRILIDSNNLKNINKKYLRSNIGLVSQEPYIFSKTVEENISITADEINEIDIVKYSKIAAVHDDIVDFKKGYKTTVGEHGATLSGGQRQRIAIARTLLKDQNILVFDDSLSAVDNETDKKIRKALIDNDNITSIIVTHKISSILDCDQVIVIEDGKIIENDTVENLLNTKGYFRELYNLQMGDNNEK